MSCMTYVESPKRLEIQPYKSTMHRMVFKALSLSSHLNVINNNKYPIKDNPAIIYCGTQPACLDIYINLL